MKALNNELLNDVYRMTQVYMIYDYRCNMGYTLETIAELLGYSVRRISQVLREIKRMRTEDEDTFQWYIKMAKECYNAISEQLGLKGDE